MKNIGGIVTSREHEQVSLATVSAPMPIDAEYVGCIAKLTIPMKTITLLRPISVVFVSVSNFDYYLIELS